MGNEKDKNLERVSLKDFLNNIRNYLSNPNSWKGNRTTLLARDTHALVSAQACFLPIPQKGKAEFNPVLFNYQSYAGDPAVLTILATREGTSVTIIDNKREGFEAGSTCSATSRTRGSHEKKQLKCCVGCGVTTGCRGHPKNCAKS